MCWQACLLCVCVYSKKKQFIYWLIQVEEIQEYPLFIVGKSVKSYELELLIATFSVDEIQYLGAFLGRCDDSFAHLLELCSFSVPQFS